MAKSRLTGAVCTVSALCGQLAFLLGAPQQLSRSLFERTVRNEPYSNPRSHKATRQLSDRLTSYQS